MTQKETDTSNPVVARTRQAREALAKQCGYDLDRMVELFESMQASHPDRVRCPKQSNRPKSPTP